MNGILFIISGQSGVGKNTIAKELLNSNHELNKITTCTTRPPRINEVEDKDYFFLTKDDFKDKISHDYFLEYARVHSWLYGTPKDQVKNLLNIGKNILMVIDVQGAIQVKEKMPDAVLIFIKFEPGQLDNLIRKRINNDQSRIKLNEEEILKRIKSAKKEARYIKYYDYTIVNPEGHPEKAIKQIEKIISRNS